MTKEAPLTGIEIHRHVPALWAEERAERLAKALSAGSVLVLPEVPDGPQSKMQVILFPHPDDVPDPNLKINNLTNGESSWQ